MDEALTFFSDVHSLCFSGSEASVDVNEKMKQTQNDHETSLSLDANDH